MYNKFIKYIYIIHVSMNLFHLIANPTVEGFETISFITKL
ncbi:hypothetical protein QFZ81_004937 [Paenibacillus sp. V4I9]|nr:hypothetical protein [Paenibacillus sp. V4I9]